MLTEINVNLQLVIPIYQKF